MADILDSLRATVPTAEEEPDLAPEPPEVEEEDTGRSGLLDALLAPDVPLDAAVENAVRNDPDVAAQNQKSSAKTGMPVEGVRANPKAVEQVIRRQSILETLSDGHPITEEFMRKPDNVDVAHDDTENLSKLEDTAKELSFTGAFERGVSLLWEFGYRTLEAIGEAVDAEELEAFAQEQAEISAAEARVGGEKQRFQDINGDLDKFFTWLKQTGGEQIPLMAPSIAGSLALGAVGTAILPGVGTVIGGILGAFIPSFILGVGETQSAIKSKDITVEAPGMAFGAGALIGALDSLLPGKVGKELVKAFGVDVAEQVLKMTALRVAGRSVVAGARGMTVEGITEAVQEVISEVAASQATDTEVDIEGLKDQVIEAFAAGAFLGGGVSTVSSVTSDIIKARRNKQVLDQMDALMREGALNERAPDRQAQVVAEYIRSSGVEELFINADAILEFAQQHPDGIEAALSGLGLTETDFIDTTAPIGINVDNFANTVLASDGYDIIASHVKFFADGKTVVEAAQAVVDAEITEELEAELADYEASEDLLTRVQEVIKGGITAQELQNAPANVHAILMDLIQRVEERQGDTREAEVAGRVNELERLIAEQEAIIDREQTDIEAREEANKDLPPSKQQATKAIEARIEKAITARDKLLEFLGELQAPALRAGLLPEVEEEIVPAEGVAAEVDAVQARLAALREEKAEKDDNLVRAKERDDKPQINRLTKERTQLNKDIKAAEEELAAFGDIEGSGISGVHTDLTTAELLAGFVVAPTSNATKTTAVTRAELVARLEVDAAAQAKSQNALDALVDGDTVPVYRVVVIREGTKLRTDETLISTSLTPEALFTNISFFTQGKLGLGDTVRVFRYDVPKNHVVAYLPALATDISSASNPKLKEKGFGQGEIEGFDVVEDPAAKAKELIERQQETLVDVTGVPPKILMSGESQFDPTASETKVSVPNELGGVESILRPQAVVRGDIKTPADLRRLRSPIESAIDPVGFTGTDEEFAAAEDVVIGGQIASFQEFFAGSVHASDVEALGDVQGPRGPQQPDLTTEEREAVVEIADKADEALKGDAERAVTEFIGLPVGAKDKPDVVSGIMSGQRLEEAFRDAGSAISKALDKAFKPVRERIRKITGDTVTLYRLQRPVEPLPEDVVRGSVPEGERSVLSWTADPEFADQLALGGRRPLPPPFTEEEIQKAEADLAEKGEVQITKNTRLVKQTVTIGIGPKTGQQVDEITIFSGPGTGVIPAQEITDTGSVREYMESLNADRQSDQADVDASRQNIVRAEVSLDDVVWVSDRAGQSEFIVRNDPASSVFIDETGTLIEKPAAKPKQPKTKAESLRGKKVRVKAKVLQDLGVKIGKEAVRAARDGFKAGLDAGELVIDQKKAIKKEIDKMALTDRQKGRLKDQISDAKIRTDERLRKVVARVQARAAVLIQRNHKKQIQTALAKVIKDNQGKKLKTRSRRLTPDISALIDRLPAILAMDAAKADKQLAGNQVDPMPVLDPNAPADQLSSSLQIIENMALALASNPDAATDITKLENLLISVNDIVAHGRAINKANLFDRAATEHELRAELLELMDPKTGEKQQVDEEGELVFDDDGEPVMEFERRGRGGAAKDFGTRVIGQLFGQSGSWKNILLAVIRSTDRERVAAFLDKVRLFEEARDADIGRKKMVDRFQELMVEATNVKPRKLLKLMQNLSTQKVTIGGGKKFLFSNGERKTIEVKNMAELIHLVAQLQNPDVNARSRKVNSEGEGDAFTDDIISALRDAVAKSEHGTQIIEALTQFYAEYYPRIDEVYSRAEGIHLAQEELYIPTSRHGDPEEAGMLRTIIYKGAPGGAALKARTSSVRKLRRQNAFAVVQSHVMEMEYYIAYHDKAQLINAIFNGHTMGAIEELYGSDVFNTISQWVQYFSKKGRLVAFTGEKFYITMMRNFTVSQLAISGIITIKQLMSFPAFAEGVNTHNFVLGIGHLITHPIHAWKVMNKSRLFSTRGNRRDQDFIDTTANEFGNRIFNILGRNPNFTKWITMNIKIGDKGAILLGGYAHYWAKRKELIAKGMDVAEAEAKALKSMDLITVDTQQSPDPDQQSQLQRSNSFGRLWAQFGSSANALWRAEMAAYVEAIRGRSSVREVAKAFVIFHLIIPSLIQLATNLGHWDQEDQERAWIWGSWNGLFILGDAIEASVMYVFGEDTPWELKGRHPLALFTDILKEINKMEGYTMEEIFTDMDAIDRMLKAVGGIQGMPFSDMFNAVRGVTEIIDGDTPTGVARVLGASQWAIDENLD